MSAFFFYGTLMHPDVLMSVIRNDGSHLSFQPAFAQGWKRFKVEGEDYPAIISSEGSSVRGTLVHGLAPQDVKLLTEFEGPEYAIKPLSVDAFGSPQTLARGQDVDVLSDLPADQSSQKVETQTYVWIAGDHLLERAPWDFAHFTQEKLHLWTTPSASQALPDFGHGLLKYWSFKPGYVNLNHGSYGSAPIPVQKYCRELQAQSESCPDRFIRREYLPLLTEVRETLAETIKAKTEEVVLVTNATTGVNVVLSNIVWRTGDVIVAYSTSYGAILQSIRYVCDRNKAEGKDVQLVLVNLNFPMTHDEIVAKTEEVLSAYNVKGGGDLKEGKRVRMVVVDGIASMPGMILPWQRVSSVCKEYGALSIVDGAHLIGQVEIDLSDDETCDFLISNMHKWLYAQRSAALLWVPVRNQHLIRTSFPTSFDYESELYPGTGKGPWNFVKQFDWTGTVDLIPFLSVTAAVSFRAFLGGEKRINDYCHLLAISGGKRLQELFSAGGKEMIFMENDQQELTANMVNVELPISPTDISDPKGVQAFIEDFLFAANTFAPVIQHDGRCWVRCSAQVWNELEDFDYLAKVLLEVCSKIKDGSWEPFRRRSEGGL